MGYPYVLRARTLFTIHCIVNATSQDFWGAGSSLLAAEIIASNPNVTELTYLCDHKESLSEGWQRYAGAPAAAILKDEICKASKEIPSRETLQYRVEESVARLVTILLINSFKDEYSYPGSPMWRYLCENLNYERLNLFSVNTSIVDPIASVCQLGGMFGQTPKRPDFNPDQFEPVDAQDLANSKSDAARILGALVHMAAVSKDSAERTEQNVKWICDNWSRYHRWLDSTSLNVTLTWSLICDEGWSSPITWLIPVHPIGIYGASYIGYLLSDVGTSQDWYYPFLLDHFDKYKYMDNFGLQSLISYCYFLRKGLRSDIC